MKENFEKELASQFEQGLMRSLSDSEKVFVSWVASNFTHKHREQVHIRND